MKTGSGKLKIAGTHHPFLPQGRRGAEGKTLVLFFVLCIPAPLREIFFALSPSVLFLDSGSRPLRALARNVGL